MRLLDCCRVLSEEELRQKTGNSAGGILETLQHIFWADRIWLSRLEQVPRKTVSDPDERYTLDELSAEWNRVYDGMERFVATADPDEVCRHHTLEGVPHQLPNWQVLLHVVNHATYHRGQVATLLRQRGYKPESTDLAAYYRTQAG